MTAKSTLPETDFDKLRRFDTCSISNAIERFNVRLRNEGFVSGSIHCEFPHFSPMLGYAATAKVRTSSAPMTGRFYHDNMDWWHYVASIPKPRVIIFEDVDDVPGLGASVGEMHAAIGLALDCVGQVTNGAVRDIRAVESMGFQLFAGSVSVSHAYAHITEFGGMVEIGGLKIQPGDLIHGDRNGVHAIPLAIAAELPEMASKIIAEEQQLVEFCRSRRFSLEELADRLKAMTKDATRAQNFSTHE
jgi:4-hydroxy-4-methyl-2-oxoglutarate aldolase